MHDVHLPHAVAAFLREYGEFAVCLIILLESFGVPLPGESLLIASGGLAAQGLLNPMLLFGGAFVGAVIGDNIGYLIGHLLGRKAIISYGTRFGITADRYDWAEQQFARYGPVVVAGARFVVVLRQLNGIVAGSLGMHWLRFLLFNALGAALWVGFWGTLAMVLGSHLSEFMGTVRHFGTAGIIVLVLAAIGLLAWWWFRREAKANNKQ